MSSDGESKKEDTAKESDGTEQIVENEHKAGTVEERKRAQAQIEAANI